MLYYLAILLPCAVSLVWAVALVCNRKKNSKSQNILTLYFLLSSISLFSFTCFLTEVTDHSTYIVLDALDSMISPAVLPLMYLYFKSLTSEKQFCWKDYLWFVPGIIIGISVIILYLAMGENNAVEYIRDHLTQQSVTVEYDTTLYHLHYLISIVIYSWLLLVQAILIGAYAIISIVRYHRRLKDFYSNLENKSMDVDRKILGWFLISVLMAIALSLTAKPLLAHSSYWTGAFFTVWAATYFGLGYCGFKSKYTINNLAQDLQRDDVEDAQYATDITFSSDNTTNEDAEKFSHLHKYDALLAAFDKLMDEDKLFLRNDMRADEVARLMFTNRIYVAKVIKGRYQCTFSDYINHKRIEYSMQLMRSNPEMRQEDLAEKSGFLSGSTFNKTFKQVIGMPPGEWLRNNVGRDNFKYDI